MKLKVNKKTAYLLDTFPTLSETFIYNEIVQLKNLGMDLTLLSLLKNSEQKIHSPEVLDLSKEIRYLFAHFSLRKLLWFHLHFLLCSPRKYFKTLGFAFKNRISRSLFSLIGSAIRLIKSKGGSPEERRDVFWHFVLSVILAKKIHKMGIDHIHSHFADASTSFAMLLSRLLDIPYSFTAHAFDVFVPQDLMEEKLERAKFIVTCTKYNKKFLIGKYPQLDERKIHVIYHGIRWQHFSPEDEKWDGRPVVLTVGRLVKKKGINILIDACRLLQRDHQDFECWIVGDGPERDLLEFKVRQDHLEDKVKFWGAVSPSQVRSFYNKASMFVLPCVVEEDGNRDGIPNVLVEAMAMKLPVVSTHISAIPELIDHERNGFLLPPGDHLAVASTIKYLLENKSKAQVLGENAREKVIKTFDLQKNTSELKRLFETLISHSAPVRGKIRRAESVFS